MFIINFFSLLTIVNLCSSGEYCVILNKSSFSLFFSIVLLVKALIDYMMIGLIEISKSFYIKMLNIPISSISIDSYLIVAMVSLMIGMILFVWHIYKAE